MVAFIFSRLSNIFLYLNYPIGTRIVQSFSIFVREYKHFFENVSNFLRLQFLSVLGWMDLLHPGLSW